MPSPSLIRSSSLSFQGQLSVLSPPFAARSPYENVKNSIGVFSVRAVAGGGPVLVEKSEADKQFRLKTTYLEKIVPILKEEFGYTNVQQVPKIEKIVVNCGIGDAHQNAKGLEEAINHMSLIVGQRPIKTRAKKSIAMFKIREGQLLGIAVTLRRDLMYAFLDRFINLGLPRSRDFQGVSPNSFDGNGNYSLGITEQSVFPEIRIETVTKVRGMDVNIVTTAKTDKEALRLLTLMGMPFKEYATPSTRKKRLKKLLLESRRS